ncbi:MAG: hypothetical protein PVF17_04860 [Ignavibacteria bacterium]|jgi:hypothetical protein
MKKAILIISFLLIPMLFLTGCENNVGNSLIFRNFASNTIYINFRANLITVPSGETAQLTTLPKGTYSYETTYEVPVGTIESKSEGDVSGDVVISAGTRILVVYSSTFVEGVYTIGATKTTSDDQTIDNTELVSP